MRAKGHHVTCCDKSLVTIFIPPLQSTTTLTTNDIVINKLTQILSYLRQGRRDAKKLKKKEKGKLLSLKDLDKVPKATDERYNACEHVNCENG